jgi:septum formation protein
MEIERGRDVVLASSSPRRRELLGRLGLTFQIVVPDVDETALPGERPDDHVRRLAADKARTVADRAPGAVVLAADTIVVLDGDILGKPVDGADACRLLGRLAGRTHMVYTGVAVVSGQGRLHAAVVNSAVTISQLSPEEIAKYVATGEPLDKAGAYAVQGGGGRFVTTVAGSLTNVIGLPLQETHSLLTEAGCQPTLPTGRL